MNRYRRSPRRSSAGSSVPIVAFLIVASFGILFAGCSSKTVVRGPEDQPEDVTFTQDDVAKVQEGTNDLTVTQSGSLAQAELPLPLVDVTATGSSAVPSKLDLSMLQTYATIRTMAGSTAANMYRVTNDVLKVRSEPSAGGAITATLNKGDLLQLVDFVNAGWASVQLSSGGKGFVSARYIAKVTSEEKLPEDKKEFQGQYYVHFTFVNVRKSADPKSEKLGEIPQNTFVKPISIDKQWARISYQGKEGYVSADYLTPFLPVFLVRQDTYHLPILRYDASQPGMIEQLVQHTEKLKQSGYKILTLKNFYDLLIGQEQRDLRLDPKSVVIVVTELSASNIKSVSDALSSRNTSATLFLQTSQLGLSGITEKSIMTLLANGFDLQSGGHTGDDLRSLTNAQVKLELEQSRELLEQYTKKPVFAVAYPQGGINDRVMDMAAAAGYLFGLGNAPESSFSRDQLLRMPGFAVTSAMTADDILTAAK